MICPSPRAFFPVVLVALLVAGQAAAAPAKSGGGSAVARSVSSAAATGQHAVPCNPNGQHTRIRLRERDDAGAKPIGQIDCARTSRIDGKGPLTDHPSDCLQGRASS